MSAHRNEGNSPGEQPRQRLLLRRGLSLDWVRPLFFSPPEILSSSKPHEQNLQVATESKLLPMVRSSSNNKR